MCGIAGLFGNFKKPQLAKLASALAHRGPDGEGLYHNPKTGIGLVHRRLSIIDLSTAASQPMECVEGRYQVVFNGEIYNFKEIVKFLKVKGYEFNYNSDTAVLAPLFHLEGPEMLDRLEGMFAFAIWDTKEKSLFIARDHAGIKPFYYAANKEVFAFASEMKALLPILPTRTPNTTAMAEYVTFLWTPGERTMLEEVRKLSPGHYLWLKNDKDRQHPNPIRWYSPPLAPQIADKPIYNYRKTPQQLLQVLDDVVAEQCTSDVPIGAFLSGGVDSSAIVASMVATGNMPKQTYCIGFAGQGLSSEGFEDDMAFAQNVAKHLGVPFTPLIVEVDPLLSRLPNLPFVLDEPTADPAPLFVEDIAARARADNITVLLAGTGGDDVFSGYRRHQAARMRQWLGPLSPIAGQGLCTLGGMLSGTRKRRFERLGNVFKGSDEDFLISAFTTNSQPDAWQLLRPDLRRSISLGWSNALITARAESHGQDLLNRVLYQEMFGFLPDHNLNYNDKASMLAGVEGRVPLIDRRIMEFMADVPPSRKLRGYNQPKWFFKQAVAPRLPREVITRSKAGFGAPIRTWLTTGKGRKLMEEALFESKFTAEYYEKTALQSFWQRTLTNEIDGVYTCLAVAMQTWWLGKVIDP